MASLKFEEALSRLEEAVKSLEKGDLPLEDSLKVFEEGIRLSKSCLKILEEAEKKVEILIQDKEGRKKGRPLDLKGVAPEETPRDPAEGPAVDPQGRNPARDLEGRNPARDLEGRNPEGTSSHG
ncbi:MAG TPA: exodeoxyribonuclease VII small subunit [Candidatus Manganitrophaceae bacterium]|nr:exodeoxyribonuclease VII small subunit [Candidatus Manganitrophaceae bacterium]